MEVFVHYPNTLESKKALSKKASIIHAQAILKSVSNLPCPKTQKLKLLGEIEQSLMDN